MLVTVTCTGWETEPMEAQGSASLHAVDSARDFADLCMRAAQDFMQTIVVVDDRATYGEAEAIVSLTPPETASIDDELPEAELESRPSGGSLDVAILTDASADIGLACAVLRPQQNEQHDGTLVSRLSKAARRADVLVLDWQLNDEPDGQAALRLLMDVASRDQLGQGRLRLVCFYTDTPDLDGVFNSIYRALGPMVVSSSEAGQAYWIDCGCMRVILLAKAGGSMGEAGTLEGIVVDEKALPEKLVEEFAKLTAGLVSNVAVASLAAVREDAHRLLTRFGSKLDKPFLSHRFYEGGSESEELLVRLIADEIKSLLDSADVRRWVEPRPVELWGKANIPDEVKLKHKAKKGERVLPKSNMIDLIGSGLHYGNILLPDPLQSGQSFDLVKDYKEHYKESITSLLVSEAEDSGILDYEFARLTCLARNDASPFPGDRSPVLTEGTLVRGRNGTEAIYLLCCMPLCDTVRVGEARAFPFVPLSAVGSDERYDIVALSPEGNRIYFAFSPRNHYDVVRHTFAGDAGGVVRSHRSTLPNGERFVFSDKSGKAWIWVAERRFQHAHRKLNDLGALSSRVGLDESHFLRLASNRTSKSG